MGSFVDKRGNHIEMGLHVFFGCYNNLFRLMKKVKELYLFICQSLFQFGSPFLLVAAKDENPSDLSSSK